ncbi:hypothetical protein Y032_0002g674 [Ancylostoma ceylanicum]|uniref:Phosphatidic acid phosphatase type 2/haloperoxidase domain-containing protein n=1 Tax=Ancylostoma ceylanicum TaxID=53326 RepID=A0A016W1Q7_9BILA|nr:hypothetical protein Y032_0002g674 [Ancylostoma ceylanicum]
MMFFLELGLFFLSLKIRGRKELPADFLIVLRRWDESASKALVAPPSMRNVLMWIEYTVNGYPWIIGSSLALVYSVSAHWSPVTQYQLVVLNFGNGLLSDLCCNGILKLSIQRPRPAYNINDQFLEAPVFDRFSFPSGHTSRAAMLATLCCGFFPKYRFAAAGLTFLVGLSRVAMGRHYLSDVLGGTLTSICSMASSISRILCRTCTRLP